jgi:hypothetical protein
MRFTAFSTLAAQSGQSKPVTVTLPEITELLISIASPIIQSSQLNILI